MRKLVLCLLSVLCLYACMEDDNYIVSPNAGVEIWKDTASLDTVIANEVTQTDTFKVYNLHKQPIRFSKIWLEKGSESPFRVNIDGQSLLPGQTIENVEIAKKDSLIVFFFVKATDFDNDQAEMETDKLHFLTEGGKEQHIVLKCYSQSVITLDDLSIADDQVLSGARPYHVKGGLTVEETGTLTIESGVTVLFDEKSDLKVNGKLIVNGTLEKPVVFRSDRLGNMIVDMPYDKIPGQWGGVVLGANSFGNHLNYVDIHGGNNGVLIEKSDESQQKLLLENSIIHNVSKYGLSSDGSQIKVVNTQISNAGLDCVNLYGGDSEFIHCTIANFYPFVGGHGIALRFSNYRDDERCPIKNLHFKNSIISGISFDDVVGTKNQDYTSDLFEYNFTNCLLNTERVDDELHFQNCIFSSDYRNEMKESDNFTPAFDYDKLVFNFDLSEQSKAVNSADYDIAASEAPLDRHGNSRTADHNPDMGCYEHQSE